MDPILADIYSTILPSAPFVIAAYALVLLVLLVYVAIVIKGLKNTEKQMTLLEEQFEDYKKANGSADA